MFFKSAITFLSLAGILVLAACGSDSEDAPRMPSLTLTEVDTSTAIELERGQEVSVILPATAGTGYIWEVKQKAPGVLQQIGNVQYSRRAMLPNMMEQNGLNIWSFQAVKTGQDVLSYSYHRPWGSDKPTKILEWTVTVKDRTKEDK